MHVLLRITLLAVVAIVAFAAYSYAQHYSAVAFFPAITPRPMSEMLACASVGAVAGACVASYPLAKLFGRSAWVAAAVVAAPVLALRMPEVFFYSGPLEREVRLMGLFESGAYLVALVFGAWGASVIWSRSNTALQPTASGRG